jgi:hypothetical protein
MGQKNPQKYRKFKASPVGITVGNVDLSTALIPDVNASVSDVNRILEPLGLTLGIVKSLLKKRLRCNNFAVMKHRVASMPHG